VTDSTNFLDASGTSSSKYTVTAVIKGPRATVACGHGVGSAIPEYSDYGAGGIVQRKRCHPGDLDGDGQLDIVLKWDPSNSKDSASSGTTDLA